MAALPPFQDRLAEVAERTERELVRLLSDYPAHGEIARPPRLTAAMRHGALAGGKRLRPFLAVETARLFGGDPDSAWPAAMAVELVHCYSLIHDDLPAMDDDDLRRGAPTVHRAYDEASAILAGDALLTLAFAVLADRDAAYDARTALELVRVLAAASGAGGMVGGQMFDLAAEGRFATHPHHTAEGVRTLQAMKTGALIAAAVDMGALIGGADAARAASLAHYGRALGAAFQVADDILDVEATAEELGKATGKDAVLNKATLVSVLGLEAAREERDRLAAAAVEALAGFGGEAALLRAAARFAAERRV